MSSHKILALDFRTSNLSFTKVRRIYATEGFPHISVFMRMRDLAFLPFPWKTKILSDSVEEEI